MPFFLGLLGACIGFGIECAVCILWTGWPTNQLVAGTVAVGAPALGYAAGMFYGFRREFL